MTDRFYRLVIGVFLLIGLYFELHELMLGIIALQLFEGLTNWRVPLLVNRLQGATVAAVPAADARIPFDAERGWRLMVAAALILTYLVFAEQVWFFPWFMGFAILGAGLSGVCPMLLSLKFLGLR